MKHIRKFNEDLSERKTISFEEAKDWIKSNYDEMKVTEMIDEEINSGNWTDSEQMEEEGYESEYDYYMDYGRGEAEGAVMDEIINDLKKEFDLDFDTIGNETNLYDFLRDEFNINDF
jgi:hypothetical protein